MAWVLTVRASLAQAQGHTDAAVDLQRATLRLIYEHNLGPEPIANGHQRLWYFLRKAPGDSDEIAAHLIAALLIPRLTGMSDDLAGLNAETALARRDAELRKHRPWSVAEVVQLAERTDGVRLGGLLANLEPGQQAIEEALNRLIYPRPDAGALITSAARGLARWLKNG
jgi:hypothetical protein